MTILKKIHFAKGIPLDICRKLFWLSNMVLIKTTMKTLLYVLHKYLTLALKGQTENYLWCLL